MNDAFMAKLIWDLETCIQKPWVIPFKQKYGNINCTNYEKKNSSYIYKSIYKDKNIFSNNINYIIKNGKDTKL